MNDKYLILNRIKLHCEENSMTQVDFIAELGMTSAGFYKAIKKNTLSIEKLNKIASLLGITLAELFNNSEAPMLLNDAGTGYQPTPRLYLEDRLTNIEKQLNKIQHAIQRQSIDTH